MSETFPPRIANGLGGPPRLRGIRDDEITPRVREAVSRTESLMDKFNGGDANADRDENVPLDPFTATLCRHVEMFDRFMQFGMNFLLASAFAPRDREVLTLRTGWLCDAPFEWGEHVKLALEQGLTREDIDRIKSGSGAEGWNERDRALLRAVEELHDNAMICDATWEVLEKYFDDRQLIELPTIIGQYHTTAYMQNVLRVRFGRDKYGEPIAHEEDAL
ncbi:MAG: carboxymuconolactone decarboxylase family protein [Novosphingobium sp.]|nr:carboxymuconolactone decarboxylase family protein [Novosphingobium sp.]